MSAKWTIFLVKSASLLSLSPDTETSCSTTVADFSTAVSVVCTGDAVEGVVDDKDRTLRGKDTHITKITLSVTIDKKRCKNFKDTRALNDFFINMSSRTYVFTAIQVYCRNQSNLVVDGRLHYFRQIIATLSQTVQPWYRETKIKSRSLSGRGTPGLFKRAPCR